MRALPLLLVFTTGCAELDPYIPSVSFDHLQVDDVDFQHASVQFVFAVDNPDPVAVNVANYDYHLGLEDVPLLDGTNEDGIALTPVGTSDLALPVDLQWQDVWDTVQATRGKDTVAFGLDGDFGFNTPVGMAELPYDAGGDFPAVRTPKFTFQKVRVKRLNPDLTADVAIDLGVQNDHGSSIDFQDFSYDLTLGGDDVGNGVIDDLGAVDGGTTGTLSIPLNIDLLAVGGDVVNAITGHGNLRIGMSADSNVQTPFGLLPLSLDQDGQIEVGAN